MITQPKVSVVMSVYNGELFLRETLDTVVNQTLKDIEIILVSNGSTDGTFGIMQEYAKRDDRVRAYQKDYSEAGTGRNFGFSYATGKYISFLDGDDLFELNMLEKAYLHAEKHNAEIVAFGIDRFFSDQTHYERLHCPIMNRLPQKEVFSSEEIRCAFGALGFFAWNKIFLREFYADNQLRFLDLTVGEDTFLSITAICCAKRISVLNEVLVHYRRFEAGVSSNELRAVRNNYACVTELKKWLVERGIWERHEHDFVDFAAGCVASMMRAKLTETDREFFYNEVHNKYLDSWTLKGREPSNFYKPWIAFEIERIAQLPYREYCGLTTPGVSGKRHSPELIVSLTSHPQRIRLVHKSLMSILQQAEKADRVILWLTEKDFPGRENDLPESLVALKEYGLSIEWCENLGPYQKLIPALRKYPDAVIVTADDDMQYDTDWLGLLWKAYQKEPGYIQCHRPAMLEFDDGEFVWTTTGKRYYPHATYLHRGISHAGVLYPPRSLHPDVTDEKQFLKLAPTNDDLWFWFMAIRNQTKLNVVDYAMPTPRFVEGTQNVTLSERNFGEEKLFERDFCRMSKHFGEVREELVRLLTI